MCVAADQRMGVVQSQATVFRSGLTGYELGCQESVVRKGLIYECVSCVGAC